MRSVEKSPFRNLRAVEALQALCGAPKCNAELCVVDQHESMRCSCARELPGARHASFMLDQQQSVTLTVTSLLVNENKLEDVLACCLAHTG